MRKFVNRSIIGMAAVSAVASVSHAAVGDWSGNGDPNNGGSFNTAANWQGGVPTTAGHLVNVTSGTRVVTVDSAASIGILNITQTTGGAVNQLTLNAPLTLTTSYSGAGANTVNPFGATANASAGVGSAVLNLNGNKLSFTNNITNNGNGATIANAVLFNAAGSEISNDRNIQNNNNAPVFNFIGAVNVTANGAIAQNGNFTNPGLTSDLAVRFTAGSTLDINGGTLSVQRTGANSQNPTSNAIAFSNAGSATIGATGGLAVDNAATGSGNANVSVTNSGSLSQAGAVTLRSKGTSGTASVANSGTWTVGGSAGTITRQTNGGSPSTAATFANSGTIQGGSASDLLDYNDGVNNARRLALTNTGTIAPGNGSNGSGLASVGTLELVDANVTFGAGGTLSIDVGGAATGEYDVLVLSGGTAGAGLLDLAGSGDTLDVRLVNGFVPNADFSLPILAYGSYAGAFDSLTVNGVADERFGITYNPTGAQLTFVVPEPASMATLLLTGALVLGRRRSSCRS